MKIPEFFSNIKIFLSTVVGRNKNNYILLQGNLIFEILAIFIQEVIIFLPHCLCSVYCSKNLNIASSNDKVSDLTFSDLPIALDHYHLPLLVEPFVIQSPCSPSQTTGLLIPSPLSADFHTVVWAQGQPLFPLLSTFILTILY